MVAGVFALAGCGSGETVSKDSEASAPETIEPLADYSGPPVSPESVQGEPCFRVAEVGTQLSMIWDLVVAARGASDQRDYLDDLSDEGDDLFEDIEDDTRCAGGVELANFNYEVAKLNIDVVLGEDTDQQYETIAGIGNDILELSDDEGHEWSYEFVTDASEIYP